MELGCHKEFHFVVRHTIFRESYVQQNNCSSDHTYMCSNWQLATAQKVKLLPSVLSYIQCENQQMAGWLTFCKLLVLFVSSLSSWGQASIWRQMVIFYYSIGKQIITNSDVTNCMIKVTVQCYSFCSRIVAIAMAKNIPLSLKKKTPTTKKKLDAFFVGVAICITAQWVAGMLLCC